MTRRNLLAALCFSALLSSAADRIGGRDFADFAENFDRVRLAAGQTFFQPSGLSETQRRKTLAEADRILNGELPFYNDEWITIGDRDIDWHGGQRNHQEWIAQLNRFRYLNSLADAWELTRDEKYASRAQALMEDFRRFVAEKNENQFFDPQRNNLLNLSLRMENWSYALRRFGDSDAFADAWVKVILEFMTDQLRELAEATRPGRSNFQMHQANTLILTSLFLPGLPGAPEQLKHGAEVMRKCLALQFRTDGTHWENTCGYHISMLRTALRFRNLSAVFPEIPDGLPLETIRKAIDFASLSSPWGINDHGLQPDFPRYAPMLKSARSLAKEAGLTDWQPPRFGAFPAGGLFFAGNEDEHLFFDAARVGSSHSHNSRLQLLYAAFGEIIIADGGIATYEKSSPFYVAGLHTMNHATANPEGLAQLRTDAGVLYYDLKPDYAVLSGSYSAGYFRWENGVSRTKEPDRADLKHERTVIWLAGDYLLILDRPYGPATVWNYVFPVPQQEAIVAEEQKGIFRSRNTARPNFIIQMLRHPGKKLELRTFYGDTSGPVYRGFRGNLTGGIPSPLLEFASSAPFSRGPAVTLVKATATGDRPPEIRLLDRSDRRVCFEDGENTDLWFFQQDHDITETNHGRNRIVFSGMALRIRFDRNGKISAIFADRATSLKINGRTLLSVQDGRFSGHLSPENLTQSH